MTRHTRAVPFLVLLALSSGLLAGCADGSGHASPSSSTSAAGPITEAPSFATAAGSTVPADQVDAARAGGVQVYVSPDGDGTGVVVVASEPLPQVFVDDVIRSMSVLDTTGMQPSEETIAQSEFATTRTAFAKAVAEVDVPYALVYRGQCLGAVINPDEGGWEFADQATYEDYKRHYYLCSLPAWYLSAVYGVDDVEQNTDGFDTLDAAVASVQGYVDAHPGMQLIVAP